MLCYHLRKISFDCLHHCDIRLGVDPKNCQKHLNLVIFQMIRISKKKKIFKK